MEERAVFKACNRLVSIVICDVCTVIPISVYLIVFPAPSSPGDVVSNKGEQVCLVVVFARASSLIICTSTDYCHASWLACCPLTSLSCGLAPRFPSCLSAQYQPSRIIIPARRISIKFGFLMSRPTSRQLYKHYEPAVGTSMLLLVT